MTAGLWTQDPGLRSGRRIALAPLLLALCLLPLLTACKALSKPEGWAGPRLAGDNLYVSTANGKMAALDPATLSQRWIFPPNTDEGKKLDLQGIYGAPAVDKDTVYFGAYDGYVYAVNAKDGSPKWRFKTGDKIVNAVQLSDSGALYVGSTDGKLYAIDTAKCPVRPLGASSIPNCDDNAGAFRTFDTHSSIWGSPLISTTAVYVPAMDGRFYALDTTKLQPLSGFSFKADAGLLADPVAISENMVAVGGIDQKFYAVDATTGKEKWRFSAGNWFWGRLLIDHSTIYLPNLDGHIYALDPASGAQKWSFEAKAAIRSSPVLEAGTLVAIDNDGQVYGLDPATGALKWGGLPSPVLLKKTVLADPLLLDDGKLLVVAQGGDLIRIDPSNGATNFVKATQ